MRKLYLCGFFCLMLFTAHAQFADTSKAADSVFIPLKYRNIHKRSPVLACVLSVYTPGLGQVYNKQVGKGAIIFGTFALSLGAAEVYHAENVNHPHDIVTGTLLLPFAAACIYSIVDAPITASRLNHMYHLGKKKSSLNAFSIQPGLINQSPDHYTVGLSLILR